MFQTFTSRADPAAGPERLARLRSAMQKADVDVFLIPHADRHQNEYLPEAAERLAWLTGFTGSAGDALVTASEAHVFVDGRYTLQVRAQVDTDHFTPQELAKGGVVAWLRANAKKGWRIGIDPWLHTILDTVALTSAAEARGATLVELDRNLIDTIWADQPALPVNPVHIHPTDYAGQAPKPKIAAVAKAVREGMCDATVLTDPASICWTLNLRGSDIGHTPIMLAFAIVPARGRPQLFMEKARLGVKERAYLTQLADVNPPETFEHALGLLGRKNAKVMLDSHRTARKIATIIEAEGGHVVHGADPVIALRAIKNAVEKRGARNAHLRDGVAMVHFLAWFDANRDKGLDEIKIATELEAMRHKTGEQLGMPLKDIAFDTISGVGPNGAIVHYRVTTATNRAVAPDDVVLVDSGAQYEDGTTDITRVLPASDAIKDEIKRHFTLVLKGMIAISVARFPVGTRGIDIDALARNALWQHGMDYGHGTGHGVGSYLSVHEGPQGISRRSMVPLEPGMITSNEPGCYVTGSHGIRIENLVLVNSPKTVKGGNVPMLSFETLTLCPIDTRLIERKLLTPAERRWLNRYHATVRRMLTPMIDDENVRAWLEKATARI